MNEVNALRLASSVQREFGDPTLAARGICSQHSRVREMFRRADSASRCLLVCAAAMPAGFRPFRRFVR